MTITASGVRGTATGAKNVTRPGEAASATLTRQTTREACCTAIQETALRAMSVAPGDGGHGIGARKTRDRGIGERNTFQKMKL